MAQRQWVRATNPHWLNDPMTTLAAIVLGVGLLEAERGPASALLAEPALVTKP
jgi:hypothetical protein